MKKHPYFQGGVIIDFSHISKDGGRKYIIFNKNLIEVGPDPQYFRISDFLILL